MLKTISHLIYIEEFRLIIKFISVYFHTLYIPPVETIGNIATDPIQYPQLTLAVEANIAIKPRFRLRKMWQIWCIAIIYSCKP